MKAAIIECFDKMGGVPKMLEWALANPGDFYRLAGRLIPTEINASVSGNLTLEQLIEQTIAAHPTPDRDDG